MDYIIKKEKNGRPTISREVINLIKRISKDNPDSGDGKIVGQLLELGFRVCERTVSKYKVRHTDPDKSQSWFAFIRNSDIASIDLFTVPSNSFKQMFALVIIKNSTRELVFSNATYYPNQLWLSRQLLNAFDDPPKYLLRDNDSNYGPIYKHMVEHILDMKDFHTQYRSPWQNTFVERLIGTIRREYTNKILFKNPVHLSRVLLEYSKYYNTARPHEGIGNKSPIPRNEPKDGKIISKTWLNGLHTTYHRVAA